MFIFYVKHVSFSSLLCFRNHLSLYQRSERWIVEPEKAKKHFDGAGKLPRLALGNSLLGSAHPWFYQRLSGVASPSLRLNGQICQGVQFTEQIESCLQLTHATPRIHSFFKDIALEKLAVLPLKLLFLQKEGTLYKNSLTAPFLTKYNSQNWLPWLYYCLFCCALS